MDNTRDFSLESASTVGAEAAMASRGAKLPVKRVAAVIVERTTLGRSKEFSFWAYKDVVVRGRGVEVKASVPVRARRAKDASLMVV